MSPSRRRRRASPAWEGRHPIRVAALPGRGLYARHLGHPEGVDGVHRPTIVAPGTAVRPSAFAAGWLHQHVDDVDVVHVHGLPPGQTPGDVVAAVDAVQAHGRPLVVTGYHLTDPSGADPGGYAAALDALVPRADAVVTLTESAAQEMRTRWGVQPTVLPHPHAVDFVRMRQRRPERRRGELRIGAHLAAFRMPTDPVVLVEALTRAAAAIEGARLVVHVHESVTDPGSASYAPTTIRSVERLVRAAGGTVRLHRPLSDSQLWDDLFALDVSVLPATYGSHSVWPEACADLGTQALLPARTHAANQRPCLTYQGDSGDGDGAGSAGGRGGGDVDALAESLAKALWTASEQGCPWRASPEERWAERERIAEELRGLYERLLGLDRR